MSPMQISFELRNRRYEEILSEILSESGIAMEKTASFKADVFFIDDEPDTGDVFDRIHSLRQRCPTASLFVISSDSSPEHIVDVMKAGANEFFLNPVSPQKLQEAIGRVQRQITEKGEHSKGTTYSFLSSKGGLGATMLAVNTAATLAVRNSGRSALIDLSLQSGDSSAMLNVVPKATIIDIARSFDRLDTSLLAGVMEKHAAGIDLLAAPTSPQDAYEISAEHVQKILALSSRTYKSVVVDCPSMVFGGRSLEAFRAAEKICMVTDLSVPAVRNASRLLKLFQGAGYAPQKIEVVVNRYVKGQNGTLEEVEKTLGRRVFWLFPNDFEDAIASINRGTPLQRYNPRSALARSITEFAQKLVEPTAFPNYRGIKGLLGKAI